MSDPSVFPSDSKVREEFLLATEGLPIFESERDQVANTLRQKVVERLLEDYADNLASKIDELLGEPSGELELEVPPADPAAAQSDAVPAEDSPAPNPAPITEPPPPNPV